VTVTETKLVRAYVGKTSTALIKICNIISRGFFSYFKKVGVGNELDSPREVEQKYGATLTKRLSEEYGLVAFSEEDTYGW
jgi:hypothetical protein